MLANDHEFFLYGGAVFRNDQLYDPPPANAVLGYRRYQYGPDKPLWQKGFSAGHLDDGVTRYVAYGGAVNAPSENKAWYFSGLSSPTRGPIIQNTGTDGSTRAMNVSNTLVGLDMAAQLEEKWSNTTLPSMVHGRANPEVVWVPVGKQGILLVLGGVLNPEWATATHKSENETESRLSGQDFMRVIDIYDVASKEWHQQPTSGRGPGSRTRGCAVVAPASDFSSFNIYYYGGFDGINPTNDFSDEVWALSLPSFTWTLINKGTTVHARSGHKCFMPYPDQMMVFGGYTRQSGDSITCLDQGPVVLFNLTSGKWMDSYSPARYADYGVHQDIVKLIGGNAAGSASATSPVPSGWSTSELRDVFAIPYDRNKLTRYWPYNTSSPPVATSTAAPGGSGNFERSLTIVIPAVLVPSVFLFGVGVALWHLRFRRKREAKRHDGLGDASTTLSSSRNVSLWLWGHKSSKQLTSTESHAAMTAASPDPDKSRRSMEPNAGDKPPPAELCEMEDTQVSELCGMEVIPRETLRDKNADSLPKTDTSSPVELHDTGLAPLNSFERKLNLAESDPFNPSLNLGHGSLRNAALRSQTEAAANYRHWAESPDVDSAHQSSGRIKKKESRGVFGIEELREAVPEVVQMETPISPTLPIDRYYGEA
ncbi:hypothetical protein UVI_02025650 [Ustilaginoidea virens]|uniref:Galactose oxidase/kelch, beta-propeller n=1 Tax=Ustilaginoidea virens TaxID=1159556 RepID=A0A1B5KR68_USTVR|nr:hypothetical protein UVI_02025650 [Ustilaginoidea virens]